MASEWEEVGDAARVGHDDRLFRGLLEAAPDAMVIVEGDGRMAIINGQVERLFGYGRDELLGHPVEMLVPERLRGAHAGHREAYAADPRTRPMGAGLDLFGQRKDGTQFPAEISLAPLHTDYGVLTIVTVRDVSARRAVDSALRLAYRELETFSYTVAHDLRAPLRRIVGFANILAEEMGEGLGAAAAEALGEIRGNADHMAALIDALLGLARVTGIALLRDEVDLSQLATSVGTRIADEHRERRVTLHVQPGPLAQVDPRLARTLLENLLGNAWKFTTGTGDPRVEFGVLDEQAAPTWYVRDNGAGFDMRFADDLFTPFRRLHTPSEFPGTGIGLATAQRIVSRHGGRIWAEGQPGQGATVYFTLPGAPVEP